MGEEKQIRSEAGGAVGASEEVVRLHSGELDSGEVNVEAANSGLERRKLLKIGLLSAPLILTFKSRSVWAQAGMPMSGASPWYGAAWDRKNDGILGDDPKPRALV